MNKVFRIEYNSVLGRHAVANVDIAVGFTIIDEEPIIRGPIVGTDPSLDEFVCANCFRVFSNHCHCDGCQLNVFCSSACANIEGENNLHKDNECKILQSIRSEILRELDTETLYNLISTIRVLFIRYRDAIKWKQICNLQSKVEEYAKLGTFNVQDRIFDDISWDLFKSPLYANETLVLGESGESESVKDIARFVNGVLRVNSYSCIVAGKTSLQFEGLYFFTALVSHSCVMNTDRQFDLLHGGRMVVKAAVPIKKDEIITTTYLSLLQNTAQRHTEMKKNWLMKCQCERCQDDTECLSHLSTLFVDKDSQDKVLKEIIKAMPKNLQDTELIENWLEKFDTGAYLHHSIFSQIKLYLCIFYGRAQGIEALSDKQLLRKLELCEEILQIFKILYPGIYQCRGELLFEIWITIREINRRELKQTLNICAKETAKEAHKILKFSIENSSYYHMNQILLDECSTIL